MLRRFLFKIVLEDAIQREERAYRFYEEAAAAVRLPEAAQLLNRLCAEELRHRVQLEDLQLLGELREVELSDPGETAAAAPPPAATLVPDEAPAARDAALGEDSGPAAILAVALRKEQEAVRYYDVLSRRGPLRGVRAVFRRLCREERRHVRWVERWQAERQGRGEAG